MMGSARQQRKQSEAGLLARMHATRITVAAVAIGVIAISYTVAAQSDEKKSAKKNYPIVVAASETKKDARSPRRHFRLRNPAELSNNDAENVYKSFQEKMAKGYASSGMTAAQNYQKWQRYNIAPFKSAAHGRRFVNHYANAKANAYGKFEKAGIMPVGSIIAKDNLTVLGSNKTHPGALLLMEKMPADFNYVSGDWRYTMIMPDGSIFGTTNGIGSKKVKFCIGCHLAVEKQDHLYFPPKEFRKP